MKRIPEIIGRKKEQEKLQRIVESKKSEFLALYGRRRVCRYTSAAFQF